MTRKKRNRRIMIDFFAPIAFEALEEYGDIGPDNPQYFNISVFKDMLEQRFEKEFGPGTAPSRTSMYNVIKILRVLWIQRRTESR